MSRSGDWLILPFSAAKAFDRVCLFFRQGIDVDDDIVYEKLAEALKSKLNVAAVDCEAHKSLCRKNGIQAYPTIRMCVSVADVRRYANDGEQAPSRETFRVHGSPDPRADAQVCNESRPGVSLVPLVCEKLRTEAVQEIAAAYQARGFRGHRENRRGLFPLSPEF